VTGLLYLPAAILISSMGLNNPADPRSVTLFDIPYAIYTYSVGFSLGPSTSDLHESTRLLLAHLPVIGLAGTVFATLAAAGFAQILRRVEQRVLLIAWLVVPITTVFAAAVLTANPFNPRYAITAYPAFVLVLASGLWWFSGHFGKRVSAVLWTGVVGLSLLSLSNLYFDSHYSKEATGDLGEFLNTQAGANDLILVNARYMEMAVSYYYAGQAEVMGYPRGGKSISDVSASDMRELVGGRPQVWLVLSRTFHGDREGVLRSLLSEQMQESGEERFTGIVAYHFVPRS
jgi:FtsH-binding integral membrane protein